MKTRILVIVAVSHQPGTNTVEVANTIKTLLHGLQSQLPGSVKQEIIYDRTASISESFRDVKFALLLAIDAS